jgi:hypothetical protein
VKGFGAVAGEGEEDVFESGSAGAMFERGESVAGEEAAGIEDGDARGELLDFRERVGRKKERGGAGTEDFGFKETAKLGGGDGVEAAGGLVKKQDTGLVEESASETESLDGAGGKSADLAIESFGEMKSIGELGDAFGGVGRGKPIETAEEEKIFAAGETRIETMVGAGVIAEETADGAGIFHGVVAGEIGMAAGG